MRRQWILLALVALAIVGLVLVITADETQGPALTDIVTDEGLATRIPVGWVATDEFPFDFVPPIEGQVFDQWTVARACPADGCGARSLDEWLGVAPDLPTFAAAAEGEGDSTFNVRVETFDDAYVLRAQTEAAARLVFVAAFRDGAADYVACAVRVGFTADPGLADAIVDVCRSTTDVAA